MVHYLPYSLYTYLFTPINSNLKIKFIVVYITTMLRRLHDESAGQFWRPEKRKYLEDIDIKNLKHLQNLGHDFLTAPLMIRVIERPCIKFVL